MADAHRGKPSASPRQPLSNPHSSGTGKTQGTAPQAPQNEIISLTPQHVLQRWVFKATLVLHRSQ